MKKLIVLIVIALLSNTMIAQAVVPPQAVSTAFATKFPTARLKKWEERREGYIANFKLDGKKTFAYYAADGSWKGR